MSTIDTMIADHKELVEVGKEHDEAYDSFTQDDSNWIHEEGDKFQPKTGDIANRDEFLGKLCDDQQEAIKKSHAAFSKFASDYEGNNSSRPTHSTRIAEGKIKAFFDEFGD